MNSINAEDVRRVAQLARLDLPEECMGTLTSQLESILGYVSHLQTIDTTDIPPTTRALEVVNVTREDQVVLTCPREGLLNQAPQREGDLLRVPRILSA